MTEEQAVAAAAEHGVQQLGARPVLLLYAREGERAQRAVDALAALLHRTTGDHVYDIWSARVAALAGRAPHAWVRAAVGAPHVRVLLLQTPALAALYRDQLSQQPGDALRLAEPLLGRRVAYRVPQFGATLLHYALRLVLLAPHDHHAYRKYFLATYKGLSADIMPQVVPFKRYSLPHTVPALLADLGPRSPREQGPQDPREQGPQDPREQGPLGPQPDPQLLDAFQQHAEQFVQHARDDPNYLMDELFVIQN